MQVRDPEALGLLFSQEIDLGVGVQSSNLSFTFHLLSLSFPYKLKSPEDCGSIKVCFPHRGDAVWASIRLERARWSKHWPREEHELGCLRGKEMNSPILAAALIQQFPNF